MLPTPPQALANHKHQPWVHFDSRMNEDMWVRIFYKGSKYKGAVKAAFCEIESNDLMWHDFFWIKHYGAKKPVPEKLARKAKRVGFAQPGEDFGNIPRGISVGLYGTV